MELLFLLFLPCVLWKMKFHKAAFSDESLCAGHTKGIKGILAVLIVLHHLAQFENEGFLRLIFSNIGVICVALFLFFSGYGLQKSYGRKPDYPRSLLKKRIPSLLMKYGILVLLYWGLSWLLGTPFTAGEVLASLVNGKPVVRYSWYILCILAFYVNYFASTQLPLHGKTGFLAYHFLFAALWVPLCRGLHYEEYWYNGAIAFPLGIFWAEYEGKLVPWLRRHYVPALILSFLGFAGFYSAALVAMKTDVFVSLYWPACGCFLLFAVLVFQKVTFGNPVLRFLGEISFELYGIHGFFVLLFRSGICWIESPLLWSAAVLTASILAAWGLHRGFRWLLGNVIRD